MIGGVVGIEGDGFFGEGQSCVEVVEASEGFREEPRCGGIVGFGFDDGGEGGFGEQVVPGFNELNGRT